MNKKGLSLILSPLILFLLSQGFLIWPQFFWTALPLAALVIVLTVGKIVKKKSQPYWLLLTLNPVLFFLAVMSFSAILINRWLIQGIIISAAIVVYYYLKNLYYYQSFQAPERKERLERLVLSTSFLTFFTATATIYALPIYLSPPYWQLGGLLLLSVLVILSQTRVDWELSREDRYFYLINSLVLGELSVAILFLPLSYHIKGLLAAIIFYLLVLFNNWRREGKLRAKLIIKPLVFALITMFIILLASRWR